ncbi:MAG: GDYXXLXY domain-containing protein [Bacteroidetes bacterium]|nr:GDYXXLXY domain-containing protein [Bacteroidota bacterium]
MGNKKIIIVLFVLAALAQLYVPASMAVVRELVVSEGKTYKFRTAPVDPNNIFKGKYIYLSFKDNSVVSPSGSDLGFAEEVYVTLRIDSAGFAVPKELFLEEPFGYPDYLKVKVSYVDSDSRDVKRIFLSYPFTEFYMEESKAPKAEIVYGRSARDAQKSTYALVSIADGESVLRDVLIDGVPIKTVVEGENQ